MPTAHISDAADQQWRNGLDVYATMAPKFRENLGPVDEVEGLLSKYWARTLHLDDGTTRRIDHVRTDPGYQDLTCAFHDSVEECLVLSGSLYIDGEGELVAGDYFWRPPGFSHSARTEEGFEVLLMMEGRAEEEGSGPVSRVITPMDDAGRNLRRPHSSVDAGEWEAAIGPRGWVRRRPSGLLPWQQVPDGVLPHTTAGASARILSHNVRTGATSTLVRLDAGYRAEAAASPRDRYLVVVEGTVTVDGQELRPCSLLSVPAHVPAPTIVADAGAVLFAKTTGEQGGEL